MNIECILWSLIMNILESNRYKYYKSPVSIVIDVHKDTSQIIIPKHCYPALGYGRLGADLECRDEF